MPESSDPMLQGSNATLPTPDNEASKLTDASLCNLAESKRILITNVNNLLGQSLFELTNAHEDPAHHVAITKSRPWTLHYNPPYCPGELCSTSRCSWNRAHMIVRHLLFWNAMQGTFPVPMLSWNVLTSGM